VLKGEEPVNHFRGGKATINIPYELQPGENKNSIVVFYIDGDGKLKTMRGRYIDGFVQFVTPHFSTYAVGHNFAAYYYEDSVAPVYQDAIEFISARGIVDGLLENANISPKAFTPDIQRSRGI
jgi:hypothetical protein